MSKLKYLYPIPETKFENARTKGLMSMNYSSGQSSTMTDDENAKYISHLKTKKRFPIVDVKRFGKTKLVLKKTLGVSLAKIKQRTPMNYTHRIIEYNTADVFVLEDDTTTRTLLSGYLSRHVIKSDEENDEGRKIKVNSCENGDELIDRIVNKNETYGFITVDFLLGKDSPSGRDVIRQLRKHGYKGCIIYLTTLNGLLDPEIEQHLIEVGADALILKGSENMIVEFKKIIKDLVVRDKFED